jgi:hypothetical protein
MDPFRHIDAIGFAFGDADAKRRKNRQQVAVNGIELRVFEIDSQRNQRNPPADGFDVVERYALRGNRLTQQPIQFSIRSISSSKSSQNGSNVAAADANCSSGSVVRATARCS